MSEPQLEGTGTGDAAEGSAQVPTTADVNHPQRSSGEGAVGPAADEGVDPSAGSEPNEQGQV